MNLLALEVILSPLGQRLVRATSGEEALAQLRSTEFAVVLLDVMMPGMDGLATAELARAREGGQQTPIILVTASDISELEAYAHGAVDILRKPLERRVVRAKVSVFVELFQARQQVRRQAADLAEQERRAQARTATLLNASLDAVIGMDHTGCITEFNGAAEQMFGRGRREMLGVALADVLIPPPQREAHRRGLAHYFATGESRVIDRRVELTALRADGTEFPIELAVRRVDVPGLPTFLGYVRDLSAAVKERTERQRLYRTAQAAEARNRFLAEVTAMLATSLDYAQTLERIAQLAVPKIADMAAVYRLEADGTIRLTSLAADDPAREALARELDELLPLNREQDRLLPRVIRTGEAELLAEVPDLVQEAWSPTSRARALTAELGIGSYMVVPLRLRGQVAGALSLTAARAQRHFTAEDLALAEELGRRASLAMDNAQLYFEAQEASRMKDEFLATVSHELRTPLTAILGWTHLLRAGRPEHTARALETIERNARAQVHIVEDVLDVSRIITGKLHLRIEPVQLDQVVRSALDALRAAVDAKQLELSIRSEPGAGETLGDAGRLQQVVWNLLANAIKFTPAGGRVEVVLDQDDSGVRFQVSDTGIGIRQDHLPRVFERFWQADSSSTRAFGGLGLGLALVRHLVELHGGQVTAHSEGLGHGACFRVTLPLRSAASREAAPSSAHLLAEPRVRLRGVRVLVVDDEEDVRDLLAALLGQEGAEVKTLPSARAALELIEHWSPEVLVSDIGMPGDDGYELIRQIRSRGVERRLWFPAIALTAYAQPAHRERALALGYQRHLAKPAAPAALIAAIAELAGRQID